MSHKGNKMSPKGAKGAPKVGPKSTKIQLKSATSKKVEKGDPNALSVGLIFDIFLKIMNTLLNLVLSGH